MYDDDKISSLVCNGKMVGWGVEKKCGVSLYGVLEVSSGGIVALVFLQRRRYAFYEVIATWLYCQMHEIDFKNDFAVTLIPEKSSTWMNSNRVPKMKRGAS